MKTYSFKKLDTKPEGSWLKRKLSSPHFKRTLIFSIVGGIVGFILYYLSEGRISGEIFTNQALKDTLIGIGIGVFITNSPCARGAC